MMKFSKILKLLFGAAGLFMGVFEEGGGGATSTLDAHQAADAFSSLLGADGSAESEATAAEGPEAAAERLAAQELTGDDGTEAAEQAALAAAAAGEKFTIEVDGKNVELTKAEIAEHYKNGLRQADYTRKTMEAADVRKTADAEIQQARAERNDYAQKLNNYAIKIHGDLVEQAALLTQELLDTDPLEYLRQERTFKERQANLAQAQQELGKIGEQQKREQAEAMQTHLKKQQEQLLAKLSEWKDPAKADTESKAIKQYLGTMGFATEEQSFNDHRHILLARKAMQYDALIERAGKAVKKVVALPTKVESPGHAEVSKPDGRTEALKRLGRSGSLNDAADAFAQFMK